MKAQRHGNFLAMAFAPLLDQQGARTYNERLSLRRAQAVARVLAESCLSAGRIDTVGLGASRPLMQGTSAASRRENRRVAIMVPAF